MSRRAIVLGSWLVTSATGTAWAQPFGCGPSGPIPPGCNETLECPSDFLTTGVFKLVLLDGVTEIGPINLFDPGTVIGRSDPFAEGDKPPLGGLICPGSLPCTGAPPGFPGTIKCPEDPCREPAGFPEGDPARREVHTEILSLSLTGMLGPSTVTVRAGTTYYLSVLPFPQSCYYIPSIGEVASLSGSGVPGLDFPAWSYFNVFVEIEVDPAPPPLPPAPPLKLYNKTPLAWISTER